MLKPDVKVILSGAESSTQFSKAVSIMYEERSDKIRAYKMFLRE
jgi:hypothetical protein